MKVLVATIGFGSGHNKAAQAVAERVTAEHPDTEVRVVDFLSWEAGFWDNLSSLVYFTSIRFMPSVYHFFYKAISRTKPLHGVIFRTYSKKMQAYLSDFPAEVIISTHVFCARASVDAKARFPFVRQTEGYSTDYMDDRYWNTLALDRFHVATNELKEKLVNSGIKSEKVLVEPIPVRKKFIQKKDRQEVCVSLGISSYIYTVLILGGGNGLGRIKEVAEALVDLPVQVLVVTGINEDLKNALAYLEQNTPNLSVYGYVENIHDMMDASDLCVTKPGGITIAECLAKNLPIIVYGKPLPGPETENIDYLTKNGVSELYSDTASLKAAVRKRIDNHYAKTRSFI